MRSDDFLECTASAWSACVIYAVVRVFYVIFAACVICVCVKYDLVLKFLAILQLFFD